jgi:hypothetical protein
MLYKPWCVLVQKCDSHTNPVTQAYSGMGDTRQIVTGTADKGGETVIRYWMQQSGSKKPIQPKSLLVEKRGWAFLAPHVRQ